MKRPWVFWIITIVIAALAIGGAFYFDDAVRDFIAQHQDKMLRRLMERVSKGGDWPSHLAAGLIALGVACLCGSKKWMLIFLSMLAALALAGVTARGIKVATARPRPSVKSEQVWNRFSSQYHAFPSGHVAASMGFFGVLFFVRRRIAVACLPIPILIGISRMYVSAHYLSDVLCAAILGMICAFVIARLLLRQTQNRVSESEH